MLSLISSKDFRLGFTYVDKLGGIVVTDESNQAESMESLVWGSQNTRQKTEELIPWTFHEAFFSQTLDEMKKENKSFYIRIKINSFDIYFCCFLLSCWASPALRYTCSHTHSNMQLSILHYTFSVTIWCLADYWKLCWKRFRVSLRSYCEVCRRERDIGGGTLTHIGLIPIKAVHREAPHSN